MLWMVDGLSVLLIVAAAGVFARWLAGDASDDHPHCRRCEYDLSGLPAGRAICPECGRDLHDPNAIRIGRRVRQRKMLGLSAMLLCIGLLTAAGGQMLQRYEERVQQRPKIFMDALAAGDLKTVDRLLDEHPELLRPGGLEPWSFSYTPLEKIVFYNGSVPLMRRLLQEKVPLDLHAHNLSNGGGTILHEAVLRRSSPVLVSLLLDHGLDPNGRDNEKITPLHDAATGYGPAAVAVAKLLLNAGADPNAADITGRTPLHMAVSPEASVNPAMIKLLVEGGAKLEARDREGRTPLHCAIRFEDWQAARQLITLGANPETKDNNGKTPLQMENASAIRGFWEGWIIRTYDSGGVAAVKKLFKRVPHILQYARSAENRAVLLERALEKHDAEMVQLLVDHGAPVDARDQWGQTLLHRACTRSENEGVVRVLLKKGADANARDKQGATPLMANVGTKNSRMAEMLLKHGADVNAQDEWGVTPLMIAAGSSGSRAGERMLELLLERGADPNAADKGGMNAMRWAALRGNREYGQMLVQYGAKVDICGAILLNWPQEVLMILMHNPAAAGTGQEQGIGTPLFVAIRCGNIECARLLIDNGANVNAYARYRVEDYPESPLRMALVYNEQEIALLLLAGGADPYTKDFYGKSALDYARENHNTAFLAAVEKLSTTQTTAPTR